ncbi:UNVERIFIED_CONTAM: hypothetical protein GTU68_004423 [Idotea baltica]|nr:hypothetical protein [Idotea baltica]
MNVNEPLAERLRPKTLDDYVSQAHLVGPKGVLTQHINQGLIPSMLFWGPPGTGKTTLANIIASESGRPFYTLSAINSGVKDIRDVIDKAKQSGGLFTTKNPILFIDEIHRFSKSQQDSLLQAVEKGWITLIGATTENPSFEVIPALLSRCQDIISAFIKSIRGSDPNAAVYWLARMVEGGEDVKFIARRLLILASEDIGNANPTALVIANNAFQAVSTIGFPESRIILSQCATYLACSPKSNAAYMAIGMAQQLVKQTGDLPVPLEIRNAPTKLMKELGYGDNYKYAHNYENNFAQQEFLPDDVKNTKFYDPGNNARENAHRDFLKQRWKDKYDY